MKPLKKRRSFLGVRTSRRNALLLIRLFLILVSLVSFNTIAFKLLMLNEGRDCSWITSFYWTSTNMSTLGLGDIVFNSDIGKLFTVFVNLSGLVFIIVIVPFTFFQLFQSTARIHKELSQQIRGHVIITNFNNVTKSLISKFKNYRIPYVLLVPSLKQAAALIDENYKVVAREIDDPESYEHLQVEQSLGFVLAGDDFENASTAFAIRQTTKNKNIISLATMKSAEDVLNSAGVNHIIKLDEMMGKSLSRRIVSGDALAHIIGEFDNLRIAEATVRRTPLAGKLIKETNLRELIGVSIVGVWENGIFNIAKPDSVITEKSVLVLAGSQEQIERYNELFCIYNIEIGPIIVVGGGNVGKALSASLKERQLEHIVIEKEPKVIAGENFLSGDASNIEVLKKAGIEEAHAIAITTHDDHTNIFLTALIRKLRPDIQIISRATLERTVQLLYNAGCDIVMSYASMGSSSIFNLLQNENILMIAEGVDVFKVEVPTKLTNKTILNSGIRELTGCSIVALINNNDFVVNPKAATILAPGQSIILIGTVEAEKIFFEKFIN